MIEVIGRAGEGVRMGKESDDRRVAAGVRQRAGSRGDERVVRVLRAGEGGGEKRLGVAQSQDDRALF